MVRGIDSFKEWFRGYEDRYAIIGGTACDLLMTDSGLNFRATKDIDLVLKNTRGRSFCVRKAKELPYLANTKGPSPCVLKLSAQLIF